MIFDQATDGLNTITAMLVVVLVVLATIGLGELTRWAGHRRHARKHSARH